MDKLFFLLLALGLSGCASGLTKEQCPTVDSFKLGRIDGAKGRPLSVVEQHIKTCPNVERVAYSHGRQTGIVEYCSPELAFYEGKSGTSFYNSDLCEKKKRETLIAEYKKGRKVFLLKKQNEEIDQQISEEREAYHADQSVAADIGRIYHLLSGSSPTEHLDGKKSQINDEILLLESDAPVSTTTLEFEEANSAYGLKALGAFTGTIIGFGSGHAIQGRYKSSGWKWTVAETAALTALIVATDQSCQKTAVKPSLERPDSTVECSGSLPFISFLSYIGLRIWQSVDLWSNLGSPEYQNLATDKKGPWNLGIAHNGWLTLRRTF